MSDADEAQTLARVDALVESLIEADHPYWVADAIASAAGDALATSLTASGLYRLWSALTDWYELRDGDAAEALDSMRQAAVGWSLVKDDAAARDDYFDNWSSTVRQAFDRPAREAQPDTVVGRLRGRVAEYDNSRGIGFIRADDGGPTYFFRWDEIKIDAHFKSLKEGTRVGFQALVGAAGERSARDVIPDD